MRSLHLIVMLLVALCRPAFAESDNAADYYLEAADLLGDEFLAELDSHWVLKMEFHPPDTEEELYTRIGDELIADVIRLIDVGNDSDQFSIGARHWFDNSTPELWLALPPSTQHLCDLVLFVELQTRISIRARNAELFVEAAERSMGMFTQLFSRGGYMHWTMASSYANPMLRTIDRGVRVFELSDAQIDRLDRALRRLQGDDADPYGFMANVQSHYRWIVSRSAESPVETWARVLSGQLEWVRSQLEQDLGDEFESYWKFLGNPAIPSAQELEATIRADLSDRGMTENDFANWMGEFLTEFSQSVEILRADPLGDFDIEDLMGADFDDVEQIESIEHIFISLVDSATLYEFLIDQGNRLAERLTK